VAAMGTIRAISHFFRDLFAGDPIALTFVGVVGGIGLVLGLIWWKIARDLRREDQKRARRGRDSKQKKP
jgi:hypothetical protein